MKIVRAFVGLDFGAGSSNCEARDCVIEDWTEDAFDASGDADKSSGTITTNIRFVNCHARGAPNSTGNAWEIEDGVRHVRIVDCSASDIPRGNAFGIRNHWTAGPVDVSRDIELRRVRITNVGGKYGIYSHSAPRDRFPTNRLTDVRLINVVCPAPILFYGPLENVEITGSHSVRIKLAESYAPFIPNLLGGMFLIPKHVWQDIPEKVDVSDPLNYPNEKPIGSGPFKLDYWDRGREFKVSAFKEHFNPPKCAGIIGIVYGSHDAVAAAIEKGECDRNRYILKPSLLLDLQKVPNIVAKGYPNHGFYNLGYHTRRPPLNDPAFRKAIAHVIPKELIIEAILSGLADPGGSVIAPANKFWHNPAVKSYPEDINKAKKILADAGYTWKKGKLHYPA